MGPTGAAKGRSSPSRWRRRRGAFARRVAARARARAGHQGGRHARAGRAIGRRTRRFRRPSRLGARAEHRERARGAERARRSALACASSLACSAEAKATVGGEAEDRRRRAPRARQEPARGAPARAAQGHQARARRGQRRTAISALCKKRLDAAGLSEEARTVADRELAAPGELEPAAGRAQRRPHLPRVDRRSALERQAPRPRTISTLCRRSSTRTTSASTT